MQITKTLIVVSAVLILAAGVAQAQLIVPLAGVQTFDALGDPSNVVQNHDVTPDLFVTGFGWIAADGANVGASWGSEVSVQVANTSQTGTLAANFFTQSAPCSPCGPVTATFDSATQTALPFPITDGNIRVEFYEAFVDVTDSPSFTFSGGDMTFNTVVPVELMSFTVN